MIGFKREKGITSFLSYNCLECQKNSGESCRNMTFQYTSNPPTNSQKLLHPKDKTPTHTSKLSTVYVTQEEYRNLYISETKQPLRHPLICICAEVYLVLQYTYFCPISGCGFLFKLSRVLFDRNLPRQPTSETRTTTLLSGDHPHHY